jgi:non-heme chloroperoxidase
MKALVESQRTNTSIDFRTELPKMSVRTLIIHGDKHVSGPIDLTGRKTAAMIPGARLKVYEGASHGLFVTNIDRLNGKARRLDLPGPAHRRYRCMPSTRPRSKAVY